jgi:GAF domain-containing protein
MVDVHTAAPFIVFVKSSQRGYEAIKIPKKFDKMQANVNYDDLHARIMSLCEGETDRVALMASVVCEVHHCDGRFDWTGFYRVVAPELMKVGPYQGGHGCLVIPFGRGVCGAAARLKQVQLVDDVEAFADHIACSSTTRSELVLPVFDAAGEVIAVFDIDSDQPAAFNTRDVDGLSRILRDVFGTQVSS